MFSFVPRCQAVRVAEVDLHAGVDGEPDVLSHLLATVPGERPAELLGERETRSASASRTCSGVRPRGQGDEQDVAGLTLDEGADRRAVGLADDEVALPVAGDRPVLDLGWPLAEQDHVRQFAARSCSAGRSPSSAAGAQTARQLSSQGAPALHEQRLIDRLVRHPHLRLVRMIVPQLPGDLLGRPALLSTSRRSTIRRRARLRASFAVRGRRRRRSRPGLRRTLDSRRPRTRADLPRHRRGRAARPVFAICPVRLARAGHG